MVLIYSNENGVNSMDDIVQTIFFPRSSWMKINYNYIFYMFQRCLMILLFHN